MTQIKIGFKVQRIRSPDGKETVRATIPVASIFEEELTNGDIEALLNSLERDYWDLVSDLREVVASLRDRNGNQLRVLLYWELGDRILEYERKYEDSMFFLDGMVKHLTRDLAISKNMVNRCRRFRRLYPDKDKIDPNTPFDQYVAGFEGGYISGARARPEKDSNQRV